MILFGFQNLFYANLGLKHFSYFVWCRGPIIITHNDRKCGITKHVFLEFYQVSVGEVDQCCDTLQTV